jgi:hypothetical protein
MSKINVDSELQFIVMCQYQLTSFNKYTKRMLDTNWGNRKSMKEYMDILSTFN